MLAVLKYAFSLFEDLDNEVVECLASCAHFVRAAKGYC